jgi:alkylation response protein AidB-like acyl-CoA dehydrogenase
MEFAWSPIQEELYGRALDFARTRLHPREDARGPLDPRWGICGEFGLMGLCAPEEYRGLGLDAVTTARVIEAFGRGCRDTGLLFSAAAHLFAAVMPIAEHGGAELKSSLLSRLCTGELVGANAITEPEAGSDVFALTTQATRVGDRYVLNGGKSYVTNGPIADAIVVYATMNPKHGYLGVTAFVVEKDTPGLVVGVPFDTLGLESSPICSIYLEGCSVPVENRLGAEGHGVAVFNESMQWERACLFAIYLGVMERQIEKTIDHVKQRRQFGKALGKHQAVAHRVADMKLRLEAARLLLYRACWLKDQKKDARLDISLAKLAVSEAAIQSSLDAIHLHGGAGVMAGTGVAQALRDAIPATIFSGTSEMQRDLVARSLGL